MVYWNLIENYIREFEVISVLLLVLRDIQGIIHLGIFAVVNGNRHVQVHDLGDFDFFGFGLGVTREQFIIIIASRSNFIWEFKQKKAGNTVLRVS